MAETWPSGTRSWSYCPREPRVSRATCEPGPAWQIITGKLMVIWDGAPIYPNRVVKEYLSNGTAHRVHLEHLPAYTPELNPAEGIWDYLKRVELKNLCCQTLSHLNYGLCQTTDRLRHQPNVFLGCTQQPGSY